MPLSKIGIVINELFQVSLVTYLILHIWETLDSGAVSNVFNLNYLLGIVLISGILKVLPLAKRRIKSQWDIIDINFFSLTSQLHLPPSITENDFYYIILVGFGGGLLVFFKTQELGILSYIITAITIILIFLLSYLIFTDQDSTSNE